MFKLFRKEPEYKNQDFGFTACATCTTTHTPTCSKIDNQLAQMLDLKPDDPQLKAKLADAKKLAFG